MARFRFIDVESSNGVRTITLNRPEKRNALRPELIEELIEVFGDAAECDCGVVILTGAGPAFCAGLDMETSGDDDGSHSRAASERLRKHGAGLEDAV